MAPFWSGMAIGLGIVIVVALVLGVLFMVCYAAEWLVALVAALYVTGRDGMRGARARIDAKRAKLGLAPLNRRREFVLNCRRSWRIVRHPIRERALAAESLRALKHPSTHKWSDGRS